MKVGRKTLNHEAWRLQEEYKEKKQGSKTKKEGP